MDAQSCPVCGGVIDPERLVETCRKEEVDGLLVIETPMDSKPLKAEITQKLYEIMELGDMLEGLTRCYAIARTLIVLSLAFGGGGIFFGQWVLATFGIISAVVIFLHYRNGKESLSQLTFSYNQNIAFFSSIATPPEGDVSKN